MQFFTMRRLSFLVLSIVLFLLFVFFSFLVHKDLFVHLDFDTTVRLQDRIPQRVNEFFSIFSTIGNAEVVSLFLILLLLWMRKIRGILVLGLFGLFHAVEIFGKVFVDHLPPPEFMIRTNKIVDFPQFHVRQENSFPSGHAGRASFVSAVLVVFILKSKRLSRNQKIAALIFVVLYDIIMFVSRIYLGEHWLTDVIGGILLGSALGFITGVIY